MFLKAFANQFRKGDSRVARPISSQPRPQSKAKESALAPAACTLVRSAASAAADEQLVRVTHPFHPLFQRQLRCVGKRYNRYGERLLLEEGAGRVWSVPVRWTNLGSADPEEVMGEGRLLLRMADWVDLADWSRIFWGERRRRTRDGCKGDYAANVNQITPEGALNPAPEKLHDPKFRDSEFFDPNDIVQVRYKDIISKR